MTKEQLVSFRHMLELQRDDLGRRILAARAGPQDVLALHDEASRSDDATSVLTAQLREVDTALLKMEHGEYGNCDVCGHSIELARLKAEPAARACHHDAPEVDQVRRRAKG